MNIATTKRARTEFLVYLQFYIFLFILPIFWLECSSEVYQVILVLVFLECTLVSLADKAFNIYQIFLFMMFFFGIALPIFEIFGWYSFPSGNMIMYSDGIKIAVSDKTLAETYKVLVTMLLGTSVGWLKGILKFNILNRQCEYPTSNAIRSIKYKNLFKYFFFILILLNIIYYSILFYFSMIYGYIEVMHLHVVNETFTDILSIAAIVYPLAGYSMLFQSNNKKEYKRYAVLFMIPFFIQMFTGARGEAISIFLTILFIYSYCFEQIKFKTIIAGGILVFILANVIGAFRYSRDFNDVFSIDSIFEKIVSSIASYASSMGVIAYTIELKDQFYNKIPFLFGYIQGIFSFAPNYTDEGIQEKNYLAQHLTYLIDPEKLYRGSTIGTSMGAEFYELSHGHMIIIFCLSILLLYCACYFIRKLFRNQFMFYVGAMYIQLLFVSPRGSIMKIFNKESIFCMAIIIFFNLLSRLKITKAKLVQ